MRVGGVNMLKSLKIKNFISFKNEIVIDFTKTNYTILPQNVNQENGILKGTMFVGGNGAGKSAIITALKLFMDLMFGVEEVGLEKYICFENNNPEFALEYTFIIGGSEIRYRLKYNRINEMISEKLVLDGKRILNREGATAISYFEDKEKVYEKNRVKKDGIFLRILDFAGALEYSDILKQWIVFLKNSTYINAAIGAGESFGSKKLDIYFNENGTDEINQFLERYGYDQRVSYTSKVDNQYQQIMAEDNVLFYNRVGNNFSVPFMLESLGNQNLIRILTDYLKVIREGGMLIIDEFSSGLHNELECLLVKHFMRESKNAQLCFVSHSTNLMSNSILRPDQIYTVDYILGEGSQVNRISSFQPRNSQNIEKMYNSGAFKGKPFYEEIVVEDK